MDSTARLSLPFIQPGQAQKELFHNEALQMLDTLVAAVVSEPPLNAPPAGPSVGACWIVGSDPAGAWLGKDNCLAAFTSGGWRFLSAFEGLRAFVRSTGIIATFRNGGWELGVVRAARLEIEGQKVVGARMAAIADPTGGSVGDSEARAAIGSILAALRSHGLISI